MSKKIPLPTLSRLCLIYQLCEELEVENKSEVSSIELGNLLGLPPHSIRKDITYCGEVGVLGSGYTVVKLKTLLKKKLGFTKKRRVCVVGLGRLGGALLEYPKFNNGEFTVVAGFDTSVNRLETIHTGVKVYPVYEVADVVKRESIELAIIAVPAAAAQRTAHTLLRR
jgi:redox-sensing transcriptional repressor